MVSLMEDFGADFFDSDISSAISAWERDLHKSKADETRAPDCFFPTDTNPLWDNSNSLNQALGGDFFFPDTPQSMTGESYHCDKKRKSSHPDIETNYLHVGEAEAPVQSHVLNNNDPCPRPTVPLPPGRPTYPDAPTTQSNYVVKLNESRTSRSRCVPVRLKHPLPILPPLPLHQPHAMAVPEPPDTSSVIRGMSILLSYIVLQTESQSGSPPGRDIREDLSDFMARLLDICKWSAECNLLAFVYLLRVQSKSISTLQLRRDNCKMLLVSALFIAQKFWDDQALRNQDIPIAWQRATKDKRINLKQVNGLELEMLKAMGWELYVSEPDYAACYAELVTLAPHAEKRLALS